MGFASLNPSYELTLRARRVLTNGGGLQAAQLLPRGRPSTGGQAQGGYLQALRQGAARTGGGRRGDGGSGRV
jgi:hypothetical protein